MNSFAALIGSLVTVLTMSFILYGIFFHGPGQTLGVVLVVYVAVMVLNSVRIFFGAATDIVNYNQWKDD